MSVKVFSTKVIIRDPILSYFKTLSIGPTPGIESATFRSAVKRSTDWANPAAVSKHLTRFGFYYMHRRRNLTPAINVGEAAPIGLVLDPYGLNELAEVWSLKFIYNS